MNMLSFFFLLIIILSSRGVLSQSDSLTFYLETEERKVTVKVLNARNKDSLLYEFITPKRSSITKITVPFGKIYNHEYITLWIYVKNKFWFGGVWCLVYSEIEKDKFLTVHTCYERKRKYRYTYGWYDHVPRFM